MPEPRDRDLWKQAAIFLAGVVLTAALALFAMAGSTVSASQVSEMIKTESPYVADRGLMRDVHRQVQDMNSRLSGVEREVSEMRGILRNGRPR